MIHSLDTVHQLLPRPQGCLLSIMSVGVTSVHKHQHPCGTYYGELFSLGNDCVYPQYSRSEVVLTFFERSPLDQVLKNDNVHKIQPSFQSPVKISGKSCSEGVGEMLSVAVVVARSFSVWHFGGWAQPPHWEEQKAFGEMLGTILGRGKKVGKAGRERETGQLCLNRTGMTTPVVCMGELRGWVPGPRVGEVS